MLELGSRAERGYVPKAGAGTVIRGTVNMGCIPGKSGPRVGEGGSKTEGEVGGCPHNVHPWASSSSSPHRDNDTTRSRLSPTIGGGDSERDVEGEEVVEAGIVLNDMYDPSVAVVTVELAVPGRDPGRALGRKYRSSSSDISHPPPARANGLFSCLRRIPILDVRPSPCIPSESSSDVSVNDSLSAEGRGTKDSPSPPRRTNEGVPGTLEDVAVLPLVIKLGVESPLHSHSLCGGVPAVANSCAFTRRNIGTDDPVSRPEPDRPPENASVVRSYTPGDAGVRVLWLPCVIVRMLVEVLSVPLSTPLGLPLVF